MTTKAGQTKKKRPGPQPKLISLYPLTFDEVLDTVLHRKPKKEQKEQEKKIQGKTKATKSRKPA